jgi:hypothetical protein
VRYGEQTQYLLRTINVPFPCSTHLQRVITFQVMEKPQAARPPSGPSRYRAILLVLASQLMAAVLHALARLLETSSSSQERVHPFTVLQVRLFITSLGCSTYLGWTREPAFLLGPSEVRPLLALRAIGGVLGACGFYGKIIAQFGPYWLD